jgi:hypothetical protein
MIRKPESIRKYQSAHDRFLKPALVNFLFSEFPGYFGPIVRVNIAEALISLFNSLCPENNRLTPGQMIWNALDKNTRADSPKRKYKPVILTVVNDADVEMFEKKKPLCEIRKQVMARMIREAYSQGGVLSTRDLSLILTMDAAYLSQQRIEYENKNQTVLPHTGVIHDMGSTVTHKGQIIFKYIVEKKDPRTVAYETNHSQLAVDRYIKDYNRVKTLTYDGKDVEYINLVTNISKHVITQYQNILKKHVK